jgi:hypothetical protein
MSLIYFHLIFVTNKSLNLNKICTRLLCEEPFLRKLMKVTWLLCIQCININ